MEKYVETREVKAEDLHLGQMVEVKELGFWTELMSYFVICQVWPMADGLVSVRGRAVGARNYDGGARPMFHEDGRPLFERADPADPEGSENWVVPSDTVFTVRPLDDRPDRVYTAPSW